MKPSNHLIGMGLERQHTVQNRERGYAMAALLVSLSVMSIMMSMALPVWSQAAKREREAELVFRGEQYARAIELYQRKFAGAFPSDFDTLVEQRFLRRLYEDPMSEDGEFQPILQAQANASQGGPTTTARPGETTGRGQAQGAGGGAGPGQTQGGGLTGGFGEIVQQQGSEGGGVQGGVVGVVSKSTDSSIMLYNGRGKYNEWAFIFMPSAAQVGGAPGQPGAGQPSDIQPGQGGAGATGGFGRPGGGQPSEPRSDGSGGRAR